VRFYFPIRFKNEDHSFYQSTLIFGFRGGLALPIIMEKLISVFLPDPWKPRAGTLASRSMKATVLSYLETVPTPLPKGASPCASILSLPSNTPQQPAFQGCRLRHPKKVRAPYFTHISSRSTAPKGLFLLGRRWHNPVCLNLLGNPHSCSSPLLFVSTFLSVPVLSLQIAVHTYLFLFFFLAPTVISLHPFPEPILSHFLPFPPTRLPLSS